VSVTLRSIIRPEVVDVFYALGHVRDRCRARAEMNRLEHFSDFTLHGPLVEEFEFSGKEVHVFLGNSENAVTHSRVKENKPPSKPDPREPNRPSVNQENH
jgi:hypothetical protein